MVYAFGLPAFFVLSMLPLAKGAREPACLASLVILALPHCFLRLAVWVRVFQEEGLAAASADFDALQLVVALTPTVLLLAGLRIVPSKKWLLLLLAAIPFFQRNDVRWLPYLSAVGCAMVVSMANHRKKKSL